MRAFLFLIFCRLWVFTEGGKKGREKQEGTPALLVEFATILAGEYQNSVPTDTTNNTFNDRFVPVVVDVLSPAVTFYYERRRLTYEEFELIAQQIFAFTLETPTKIRQTIYMIENPERFGTEREQLKALADLELSELSNQPECDVFWELIEDETFMATFATDQCIIEVGGQDLRPDGSRTLTCSSLTIIEFLRSVPDGEVVGGIMIPTVLEEIDNPFPVPVRVFKRNKCFEVPCTNKKPHRRNQPVWADIHNKKSGSFKLKRRPIFRNNKKY